MTSIFLKTVVLLISTGQATQQVDELPPPLPPPSARVVVGESVQRGKETSRSFEGKAEDAIRAASRFFSLDESGIVPGLESVPLLAEEFPGLKDFPNELERAIRSTNAAELAAATKYVARLAVLVRTSSWNRDRDDADDLFRLALGPRANTLQGSLQKIMRTTKGEPSMHAAAALLVLEPKNREAVAVLKSVLQDQSNVDQIKAYKLIEGLRLSQTEIVDCLAEAIRTTNVRLRTAATQAIWKIGPKARACVTALIDSVKIREPVIGLVFPYEYGRDLTLLALAEMGDDAKPAIAIVAGKLNKATFDERYEQLRFLAALGPMARDAIPAIKQLLDHEKIGLAACATLTCIDFNDAKSADTLVEFLRHENRHTKAAGFRMCAEWGPKSKILIPVFIKALNDEDQAIHQYAAVSLGRMGAAAETAVPALAAKLHEDNLVAAYLAAGALARIGKASIPALFRALSQKNPMFSRAPAAMASGALSKDARELVPALVETLNDGDSFTRQEALKALGRIKSNAASARPALTKLSQLETDANVRILSDWALSQLAR